MLRIVTTGLYTVKYILNIDYIYIYIPFLKNKLIIYNAKLIKANKLNKKLNFYHNAKEATKL